VEKDADMELCTRKHLFIINPLSFGSEAELNFFTSEVRRYFEEIIQNEYHIRVSLFPRHAVRIVRQYLTRTDEKVRVYAVGGDGILFDCLNGLVGLPNAELAAVPYGHSNAFIRAFGEGLGDVFRNIPLQATSPVIPTDILHCGSNYALNFCVIGMESAAVFQTLEIQKKFRAWPPCVRNNPHVYDSLYALGSLTALFVRKKVLKQEYTINLDGQDLSGVYANVNIANGPCCEGNKTIVTTAAPDDGLLDILMLKAARTMKTIRKIIFYNRKRHNYFPDDSILKRGKTISIRSRDPLMISLDGELFFDTNITVELIPQGVNIVTPNNLSYQRRSPYHDL
jgi:diacylglycerol kinase family enzyme